MSIMTTGSAPKAYWEGIKKVWQNYNPKEQKYSMIFEPTTSDKGWEEYLEMTTFGLATKKPEGSSITYDSNEQGLVPRLRNFTMASGFIITEEAMADCKYNEVKQRPAELKKSMYESKETYFASILNNAFDTAFTMENGDGKPLISASHPGTKSNKLTIPADLSEKAIEDLSIQIKQQTNFKGIRTNIKPMKLIVPSALGFEAIRITKSTLQNDTANNAINAIYHSAVFPGGVLEWDYLTNDKAWFIQTDCPLGLLAQNREALTIAQDNDFDTKNMKCRATERYAGGWINYNGVFGSDGVA